MAHDKMSLRFDIFRETGQHRMKASVLLARMAAANGIYVEPRNAVTCGDPRLMLTVQLAARFVPVGCSLQPRSTGSPLMVMKPAVATHWPVLSLDQAEDTSGVVLVTEACDLDVEAAVLAVGSRRIGCSPTANRVLPHCAASLRGWHLPCGLAVLTRLLAGAVHRQAGRLTAGVRGWVWRPAQCGGATLPQLVSAVWLAVRKPPSLAARSRLRTRA